MPDDTHEVRRTLTEVTEVPNHPPRKASALFEQNRRRLLKMNCGCLVCGSHDAIEIHHWFEWSMWDDLDPAKVLMTLHRFLDPYEWTRDMGDQPITTPDDIRNLVALCGSHKVGDVAIPGGHHRGLDIGIHAVTMPVWLAQMALKDGVEISEAIGRSGDPTLHHHLVADPVPAPASAAAE